MDILKAATDWAKAEVFSSTFFILFGVSFIVATLAFWQWGRTETAKAFVYPTLVVGILLLIIGFGLFFTNKSRASNFPTSYSEDASYFVESEMIRAEKTLSEFQLVIFKIVPSIMILASLLIIFVDKPTWRAISITTIAMMVVILMVDYNSFTRLENYQKQLELFEKDALK